MATRTDVTDPVVAFELRLRGASKRDLLRMLAQYLNPQHADWYSRLGPSFICNICDAREHREMHEELGDFLSRVAAHGDKHIDDLMKGDFHDAR